ncbi:translation initiation factor IF-3 [Pseudarthrobacter siccitolerans]|uniref:Translation initiation factor IF-3 n=1 Tax=Pseudarthrobacter siccitolerans TaxID=861266 RepID=A0ABU0PRC0_9MICC|nr:translation initiation factor IF-3 [Pseudarthrobacter siccitolerans]
MLRQLGAFPIFRIPQQHRSFNISEPRINERIRVPEVRLVGPAGEQVGIVRIEDALRLAAESDLDLVEVAPQAKPPVCKLMDFGKYKYEAAVKAREARKNQTNTVLKEIRFRLKIDTHDYETKRGHALRFLGAGDKVKAMIQFRGREQQRPEMGIRLLQRFAEDVAEVGVVESSPRIDGRNMVMVVGPLKNKAEAKAEARRATQRAEAKAQNEAKASGRIDVSGDDQAPLTQSLADLLPEGFTVSTEPEAAPEAPVQEAAPAVEPAAEEVPAKAAEAPKQEAPKQEAPKQEAPKQEAPKQEAPKAAAPRQEAPKAAAPRQEAPKAAAPKAAAPAPQPAAAKPEAAKPAAAAPKPAAVPAPPKPVARPAAPKPAARPAPKAVPKPAGKKTT